MSQLEKQQRREVQRLRRAYRQVLATVDGRAVLADLIQRAGVDRSIYSQSAAIHYNAGRQDFGHELREMLKAMDLAAYVRMRREADDREMTGTAERQPSATDSEDEING